MEITNAENIYFYILSELNHTRRRQGWVSLKMTNLKVSHTIAEKKHKIAYYARKKIF